MLLRLILAGINLVKASPFSLADASSHVVVDDGEEVGSPEFWYKVLLSIALVLAGGVFAGYAVVCSIFEET